MAAVPDVDVDVVEESNRETSACNGGMKSNVCGDGNGTVAIAAADCGDVGTTAVAVAAASGVDETFRCCDTAETGDLEAMERSMTFFSRMTNYREIERNVGVSCRIMLFYSDGVMLSPFPLGSDLAPGRRASGSSNVKDFQGPQ